MLAGQRDADPLVQPLRGPQRTRGRGHVIDQQQTAARAQDARHLGDRASVIRDGAQPERAQHGVERPVREVQRLGVARPQVGLATEGGRALSRDAQHDRGPVDCREPHAVRVEGEVTPGADGYLKDVAESPAAHPRPAVPEQPPVPAVHLAVIPARLLVPVCGQPLHVRRGA